MEVTVTSSYPDYGAPPGRASVRVAASELARQQGVRPIKSADDLVRDDVWDSDEELVEFLAHLQANRHCEMFGS